jgi:hypothetical protein
MQRRALLPALLSAIVSVATGCSDVGTCDDPLRGRTPVKMGNQVMYAGQAIMLASCAAGCHSSLATGKARAVAPEGLDFDLTPAAGGFAIRGLDGNVKAVQLKSTDVAGLRERQRTIYEEREMIWDQVDNGLMPPADHFKASVTSIVRFMFGSGGSCPSGTELTGFGEAKTELRKWLACGTPIIETNSSELPFEPASAKADAGTVDEAAGALAYSGAVGFQVPACDVSGAEPGEPPTFEQVYANVLKSPVCTGCHGGIVPMGGFDLSTKDATYMKLLGANGQGGATSCSAAENPRPFVKPNDPAGSYLIAKLGGLGSGTACGTYGVMPPNSQGVSAADLNLVRQWILAGAQP